MTYGERQGWLTDPFQLHEQRYFADGQPTGLVRDGDAEGYDEPPPGAAGAPAGEGSLELASGGGDPAWPGVVPDARAPWRRRRAGILAAVAVVAVIAVAGGALAVDHSGSAGPVRQATVSETAFVSASAQRTLDKGTAHLTMSMTIHASGRTVTASGTGEANFGAGEMKMTVPFAVDGRHLVQKEILADGTLYFAESIDGASVTEHFSGKAWTSLPVKTSSTESLSGTDPRSALLLLGQHGSAVRPLGTKTIGGAECTGFSVTPSRHAMSAAVQKEIAALKLSPLAAGEMRSALARMAPPTIGIWLEHSGLARQMTFQLQMGGTAGWSGQAVEDLSDYGAPVQITAPAASDVVPYQTFLRQAAQGSS
jgi:hypothetical protein